MKFILVNYICGACGKLYKAPEIAPHAYGEFLLRSEGRGDVAYLNALTDSSYKEVDNILQQNLLGIHEDPQRRAKMLQAIYGAVACDSDSEGNIFKIGLHPICPMCGYQVMKSWQVTEPVEFIELLIPSVTHSFWDSLSESEKMKRVDANLEKLEQ